MTREEAINVLSGFKVVGMRNGKTQLYQALYMAISALREQEERSKGCDYCNEPHPARDCIVGNVEQMLVGRSFADAYVQEREVKFCPMCGRRLEEV